MRGLFSFNFNYETIKNHITSHFTIRQSLINSVNLIIVLMNFQISIAYKGLKMNPILEVKGLYKVFGEVTDRAFTMI